MFRILQSLLVFSLIFIAAGCSESNNNEEELLKRIEASIKAQGFSLEKEGLQSDNELEDVPPYKYTVKISDMEADYILVYIFDSNGTAKTAVDNQHYTITTLTNFDNYIYNNALTSCQEFPFLNQR